MFLNLIFAQAANGVIGVDNKLPWHLPEDMAYFKKNTQGDVVIMGRKTWDSLPAKFRPLPGRTNIVLTRNPVTAAELTVQGAVPVASLDEAVAYCASLATPTEAWVIGGAELYAQALNRAYRVLVTLIHQDFEGDAYAPILGDDWVLGAQTDGVATSGLSYSFQTYLRDGAPA